MKKLIFILLFVPILCYGQNFFWSHGCIRPTGLTEYDLWHSYQLSGGDSTYFANNLTSAQYACHHAWDDGSTMWGYCTEASAIAVGNKIYQNILCVSSRKCTLLPTGYYLYWDGDVTTKIVYVINGIIQSVTNCS